MTSYFRLFLIISATVSFLSSPLHAQQEKEDVTPLVMKNAKMKFSEAQAEDITNDNFPDMIASFDYPDAEISEVVKAISKLTGKRFILDGNVRGKITIISPSPVTVAEAYKAFLSALAMKKYTVVPSGKFLKIRQVSQAVTDSIETYTGAYFPDVDQFITRIIKLRYISAEAITKSLSRLSSASGKMDHYAPTNSLIITDYGTNIERIDRIIKNLDVPGFEEKLAVVRIRHAASKKIADLINKIINKGNKTTSRFSRRNTTATKGGSGSESYSLVVSDERSNSVIVVGNSAGITKIKRLITQLDFPLNAANSGGVFVYHVRYGEAEKIANVINGVAKEIVDQKKKKTKGQFNDGFAPEPVSSSNDGDDESNKLFGGDVKITADKTTNSLVITASKQDYKLVQSLLSKLDRARDQVYVKAIIMEMNAASGFKWGLSIYKFLDGGTDAKIAPRIGFTTGGLGNIFGPDTKGESILSFASGDKVTTSLNGIATSISSLVGFVDFLKTNQGGNVLATPQVMAMDNEEATLEATADEPVGTTTVQPTVAGASQTTNAERKEITTKLVFTPFISPDTDTVRLKIKQQTADIKAAARTLNVDASATTKRLIETNVVVQDKNTLLLGGLIKESDTKTVTKVPLLGDIPLIGWLFKGVNVTKSKSNLLVFITPEIIRTPRDSDDLLERQLTSRLDFIKESMKGKDPFGLIIDTLPRGDRSANDPVINEEEPATESF